MIRKRILSHLPLPLLFAGLLAGIAIPLAATAAPATAAASEIVMRSPNRAPVNVNVSFNAQIPMVDTSEEAMAEAQAQMRRSFYRMARQECEQLLAEIAATCSLIHLNVNTSIQNYNNQQPPMMNANSNAGYAITLKP